MCNFQCGVPAQPIVNRCKVVTSVVTRDWQLATLMIAAHAQRSYLRGMPEKAEVAAVIADCMDSTW